jgi:hypothetical protein
MKVSGDYLSVSKLEVCVKNPRQSYLIPRVTSSGLNVAFFVVEFEICEKSVKISIWHDIFRKK